MTHVSRRLQPTLIAGALVTIGIGLPWFHPERTFVEAYAYEMNVRVLLVGALAAIVVGHVQRGRRPSVAIGALTLAPILLAVAVGQYLAVVSTSVVGVLAGAAAASLVARQQLVAAVRT